MYERFTDRARKVMQLANQEAQRFRHEYIGTEHLLLGLIQEGSGVAANVLKNLDVDPRKVRSEIERILQHGVGGEQVVLGRMPHTPRTKKVIEYAIEEAKGLNHSYVGTEHLLLGLLREEEGVAAQVLMNLGLKREDVREEVLNLLGHNPSPAEAAGQVARGLRDRVLDFLGRPAAAKSKTPALDSFGRDLVAVARGGTPPLLPARPDDVDRVLHLLCRAANNSPVVIGEREAVSAVLEAVAVSVVNRTVPEPLADARLVALPPDELLGWADDRHLYDRGRAVVNEAARGPNVWLVVWGKQPFGPGRYTRRADTFLLRRFLTGGVRVIWCLSENEYFAATHDRAFAAATVPVRVAPLSDDDLFACLKRAKGRYEKHHQVMIPDEALRAAVEHSRTPYPPHASPADACNLLDAACGAVRLRLARSGVFPAEVVVSAADVAQAVPPPSIDDIPF